MNNIEQKLFETKRKKTLTQIMRLNIDIDMFNLLLCKLITTRTEQELKELKQEIKNIKEGKK